MDIQPIRTRIFNENEDLFNFIIEHIPSLSDNSILAITSKIVALAEGRIEVIESKNPEEIKLQKEKIIRQESDLVIRTDRTWLTTKNNNIMSSAGVDSSNSDGKFVLLPKNSFKSAEEIREKLLQHYNISNLGIIITDSRSTPFKAGAMGVSLGYAGFQGLKKYAGTPDLFGHELQVSRVNIADCLASSAVLTMGEAAESQPLAIITETPVTFANKIDKDELVINIQEDLYKPYFDHIRDEELEG